MGIGEEDAQGNASMGDVVGVVGAGAVGVMGSMGGVRGGGGAETAGVAATETALQVHSGTASLFARIGIGNLYDGVLANILKEGPPSALYLGVYEFARAKLGLTPLASYTLLIYLLVRSLPPSLYPSLTHSSLPSTRPLFRPPARPPSLCLSLPLRMLLCEHK